MKTDEIAISIVSAIFLVYVSFVLFEIHLNIVFLILLFSPAMVIYMVYSVLKYGLYRGHELKEGQEFGYLDKPELGTSHSENF